MGKQLRRGRDLKNLEAEFLRDAQHVFWIGLTRRHGKAGEFNAAHRARKGISHAKVVPGSPSPEVLAQKVAKKTEVLFFRPSLSSFPSV
ncbi:MAG: hypothetical protein ACREIA_21695 [Opitutaceae bacterium]